MCVLKRFEYSVTVEKDCLGPGPYSHSAQEVQRDEFSISSKAQYKVSKDYFALLYAKLRIKI